MLTSKADSRGRIMCDLGRNLHTVNALALYLRRESQHQNAEARLMDWTLPSAKTAEHLGSRTMALRGRLATRYIRGYGATLQAALMFGTRALGASLAPV